MSSACSDIGKVALYTTYNLGLCIPIGILRTSLAAFYLVKHCLNATNYKLAYRIRNQDQGKAVEKKQSDATEDKERSVDYYSYIKEAEARAIKVLNFASNQLEELDAVQLYKEERRINAIWQGELIRGISEIIWIGAPIWTGADFLGTKNVGIFSLEQLQEALNAEKAFDQHMHPFLSVRAH